MIQFNTRKLGVALILIIPAIIFGACQKDDHDDILLVEKSNSWLGVQVVSLSDKILKNMDIEYGVKITRVYKDSPAETAGLENDDIIMDFDGRKVANPEKLIELVRDAEIGAEVEITFLRRGEQKTSKAKIAERHENAQINIFKSPRKMQIKGSKRTWLGVETTSLNDQLRSYFKVPEDLGVLVKEVVKDSPAEAGGIQAGDVIVGVADRKIRSSRDLSRSIYYYDPDEVVEIKLVRDKKEKSLRVKLAETKGGFNFHFFGDDPEHLDIHDFFIENPEIELESDIQIEIDEKKLEDLEQKIEQQIKVKTIELKEKLNSLEKELQQKLEKIQIRKI